MDNVINMFSAKEKIEADARSALAIKDIDHYEKVILNSIENFDNYSVIEKRALYASISIFNVELLKILHLRKEKVSE